MTKSLWQPPWLRTVGETEEDRRATWLELFYDLIFVAAVSQVAHYLSKHISVSGFF
jgi:low temperature requirement protein LtrA